MVNKALKGRPNRREPLLINAGQGCPGGVVSVTALKHAGESITNAKLGISSNDNGLS